jgi:hypothetical protein
MNDFDFAAEARAERLRDHAPLDARLTRTEAERQAREALRTENRLPINGTPNTVITQR